MYRSLKRGEYHVWELVAGKTGETCPRCETRRVVGMTSNKIHYFSKDGTDLGQKRPSCIQVVKHQAKFNPFPNEANRRKFRAARK